MAARKNIDRVIYFERVQFPGIEDSFRCVRTKNATNVLPDDEIDLERLNRIIESAEFEVVIDRRRISDAQ